jgi:penicillin-binding protein 1A
LTSEAALLILKLNNFLFMSKKNHKKSNKSKKLKKKNQPSETIKKVQDVDLKKNQKEQTDHTQRVDSESTKPHPLKVHAVSFLDACKNFVNKRARPLKIIFKIVGLILALGIVSVGSVIIIFGRDLPDVRKLRTMSFSETTHIYDRSGQELYSIFNENRENVELKDISPHAVNATIAIEDKKFYSHFGFDPVGIIRAQLRNFRDDEISQGGSTITQQLARNVFLSKERTYERKIKELLLALEIEWFFDKEEILEMYLNKISYGSNAYGIEAAAQTFFGVPAKKLSLVQASILASLPQSPSALSPFGANARDLMGYCKSENELNNVQQENEESLEEPVAGLTLKLKALSPAWISVIINGQKQNFTLKKDEERTFEAEEEMQVQFGNKQVEASLNGQKIIDLTPGKYFTYNLENWITLVENPDEETVEQTQSDCSSPDDPRYVWGRKDFVLQRMVIDRYITEQHMLEAWREGFKIKFVQAPHKIKYPHFVFYVKEFLEKRYGKERVENGGLQVTTTLDPKLQEIAEKAISDHVERIKRYRANNAGLVALDPKTGQILAMVGSRDYWNTDIKGQVNVTTSYRAPGSSFKPFIYAAAIQNAGIGSGTFINDYKTRFNNEKRPPNNYDGKFLGQMTARKALGGSRNIPAIKAFYIGGGEEKVLDFVDKFGFNLREKREAYNKKYAEPNGWRFYYGWPMAIGSGEVRLLDLISGYSVFANEGKLAMPVPILEVRDSSGFLIESFDGAASAKQIIDPQVAYIISSMLSDVAARPAGSWRSLLTITGQNVAAKTGTSNNDRMLPNNDLTIGYTPSFAAGVWVGNSDGSPLRSSAYSLYTTDPIYKQFFTEALKDKPREEFVKPEGLKWRGKEVFPSWGDPKKTFEKMFKRIGGDPKPKDPSKPPDGIPATPAPAPIPAKPPTGF